MGIVADALAATFTPELATWNHASFAVGAEDCLVCAFGQKFGFTSTCDGTFTSGGAEANHTA
jgi:glutamate/tyrosine decarboxylase-like PLP-dependent enzyme